MESTKMSSTCVCHNDVTSYGYACSNCLTLHCCQPMVRQLKELKEEKTAYKKKMSKGQLNVSSELEYLQQESYAKLR